MTLEKSDIFLLLIITIALTEITQIFHINFWHIGTILTVITTLIIPGILLLLTLRVGRLPFWLSLVMAVGLSLAQVEFVGLLQNQLLPTYEVFKPLSHDPTLIWFAVYLLILYIVAMYKSDKKVQFTIPSISISFKNTLLYTLPLCLIAFAIFGTISVNNGGSNILLLIQLLTISGIVILLTWGRNRFPSSIFPFTIYCIALSLLFTTSLRSWYVSGHDIMQEYYVFHLTKQHGIWDIGLYRDAYNACLSITILPTIFSNLFMINDMYIYKVVFQMLFGFCPVLVYYLLKKYTADIFGFLAAFYFMSFPTFFNDMPMLNRQEIGLLFFGLLLIIVFDTILPTAVRRILFVVFGLSIIVSHYSTNYIVLALFIIAYISQKLISGPALLPILNKSLARYTRFWQTESTDNIITKEPERNYQTIQSPRSKPSTKYVLANPQHKTNRLIDKIANLFIQPKNIFSNQIKLPGDLILILLIGTIFWNAVFTRTANNFGDVASKVYRNIFIHSQSEGKSVDVSYSIFFHHTIDPQTLIKQYITTATNLEQTHHEGPLYTPTVYTQYPVQLINQAILPSTFLGNALLASHVPLFDLHSKSRALAAGIIQLLVFIGLLGFVITKIRKPIDTLYIYVCLSCLILLCLEVILPDISAEYGLLRLFQQSLFLLSLPIVLATYILFFFIGQPKRIYFMACIAIGFFLNLTGFFAHLTGSYYPTMTLDNAGIYYDAYYVNKTSIVSAQWLKQNRQANTTVQTDISGSLKLLAYGDIFALDAILPPVIEKDSYVYLPNAKSQQYVFISVNSDTLIVNSPEKFLEENKNLIYNNGWSKIYK